jgi:hypothetical protein
MGKSVTMIGVTVIDPAGRSLQGILMTIEGLVLFDGLWQDGKVTVSRAVPPFDRPAFAENMINDMCFLFLVPKMAALTHAMEKEGKVVCRYHSGEDSVIEVMINEDRSWASKVFRGSLSREIRAAAIQDNVPQFMELKGQGYTLKLTTISAEPHVAGTDEKSEI